MLITVTDRQSFKSTSREYLDNGFLRVPGHVSRTGIQEYLASELQLDGDPNRIVKVFRPDEEVFSQDALDSFNGMDITLEHPDTFVNPDNYKQTSVGVISGAGVRDGDFVKCDLIIKDSEAIKLVEAGKVQLSVGYSTVYDDKVPDGADYDFIQRNIRVNHTAICDRARAGAQARLFDNKPENKPMTVKVTLDSGRSVEVQDEATATLVTDTIERLEQRAKDAEAKADKAEAEAEKKDEELTEEKKKSSDSAIADRVAVIAATTDAARKIAGKEFACDSLDITAIQRAALTVSRPNVAWDSKSEVYVQAAFDMEAEKDEEDEDDKESKDSQYNQLAQDAAKAPVQLGDARQKSIHAACDAWKKTAGETA